MLDMSKYAGVQNPQLYQEILDKERKRQQSQSHSPPYEPGYAAPSSSNWTPEQKQSAVELMGKTQSTNLYSSLRNGVYGSGPVQAPKPSAYNGGQAREPKPGVYLDTSNGEISFTEIFKGIGDAAIDYARTGEMKPHVIQADPAAQNNDTPVPDEWILEFVPVTEDGTYEAPMDWLFPKQNKEVFSPKNQAIGFALREDSDAADAYVQMGWGNEVSDMNTARDYYDGLLTPEEIAELSPEQLRAIQTWCQMEETRRDMFEQLINYGQRGNYTWENLVEHMKKMTYVIKYDPAIFRESIYGIYKFGRGALGFFLSPLELALGSKMDQLALISEQLGQTEQAEWYREQSIGIKTEAGLEWLDDKMAEWMNIRKGSVKEGDVIEQFGRNTARIGTTLWLNSMGVPPQVANLLGAADTTIQATAAVYDETGDAEKASNYGITMGVLDFSVASLLDVLKLGSTATNPLTQRITKTLSGSIAGKALMVILNTGSGAALNTLGYALGKTAEYHALGSDKHVTKEEIADTFAKFLKIGFCYEVVAWILGGYESPENSKGQNASGAEDAGAEQPASMRPGTSEAEQATSPSGNQQKFNPSSGASNTDDAVPPWMSGGATAEDVDGMTARQQQDFVQGLGGQGNANQDPASLSPTEKRTGNGASVETPDTGKNPSPGYESDTAEDLGKVIEAETGDKAPAQTGDYEQESNPSAGNNSSDASAEYTPPTGGGGVTEKIQIGENTVTLGHGGRHLDGTDLSVNKVNQAIAMDVCKNPPKPGEYLVRTIEIDGVTIGYRVYARSDSTFHVGTYYIIKE